MSDQNLRDKLASEYADKFRTAEIDTARDAFIDGWNAARANEPSGTLNLNTMGLEASVKGTVQRLEKERDQLKAAAEKLAEALDCINDNAEIAGVNADTMIARLALAEYRKQFKKD